MYAALSFDDSVVEVANHFCNKQKKVSGRFGNVHRINVLHIYLIIWQQNKKAT